VFNFETIYQRLLDDQGVQLVENADELARAICSLIDDPEALKAYGERALAVVNKNRGALDKVVEGITERL